jgi:hypothetical protein
MPGFISATILAGALLLAAPAAAQRTRAHHRPGSRAALSRHSRPAHSQAAQLRGEITLALGTAERYWGSTPCNGQILVTADLGIPAGMPAATDAWVTFASSLGANNLAAPADSYTGCRIGLALWQWPTAATIRSDWGMFCLTITHELGHLLGHPHSLAPHSVMAPVFIDESSVPTICHPQTPSLSLGS